MAESLHVGEGMVILFKEPWEEGILHYNGQSEQIIISDESQ